MTNKTPWPIIVLSLDGEDARRAPLLERLAALGLPFEVFIGIDGRKGLPPRWEAEIDRNAALRQIGREMTDGEFACALSHREIYRNILSKGWGGAVVLEDDAIIGQHFDAFIKQAIYDRSELLMLDHSHARVWRGSTEVLQGVKMCRLSLSPSLATAYSIGRGAAEALVTANKPVRNIADWPCDVTSLDAFALVPQIVGHPDHDTGISHLRQERQKAAQAHRKSDIHKLVPLLTFTFWRHWFIKRLSRRVS